MQANVESTSAPRNDFETAIEACGFGIYNVLLLLLAIPGFAATMFETTTMSYVLPWAECQLKLSMMNKGTINAVVFAGMILAAIPLGFIADTYGRKPVIMYSLAAQGVFVLCGACSQNFIQLVTFKFLSGFCASAPFGLIMSYISEFHGKMQRSRVMMATGILNSITAAILPGIAYIFSLLHFNLDMFGIKWTRWNVFVAVTAAPCLLTSALLIWFPESPKFLMSQGKNAEALEVFKTIFAINKFQSRANYPLTELVDETIQKTVRPISSTANIRNDRMEKFKLGLQQLKPMFAKPYLQLAFTVYLVQFLLLMCVNSLRLWLPQIFASATEMELQGLKHLDMCSILDYNVKKTELIAESIENCVVNIAPSAYINNIITASVGIVTFIVATLLVNLIGNRVILCSCLLFGSGSGGGIYWSHNTLSILIPSCIYLSVTSIANTALLTASINLFPTSMRSMTSMLAITFGRIGSLLGNLLFPYFISLRCLPPFLMISTVLFCAFILSLFLPNSTHVDLK